MTIWLISALILAAFAWWFVTQVRSRRPDASNFLRPGVAEGILAGINERRHERGLPMLEWDEGLLDVAENKAIHELQTGESDQGWDYPSDYEELFGRSLFVEMLVTGPTQSIVERVSRERELFDGEWISCGIGVAGGHSNQVVVAMILSRQAWEPVAEKSFEPRPVHS